MTYYDVEPVGTIEGDKAAVIAASLAARDAGELTVRLADGDWKLDGLTVSDIHHRYLILERGTVTPNSWVYPFRPHEWAIRGARTGHSGGSGRIAIEVDDAIPAQWTNLFPLTKRLGIPLSVAWHTGNGALWIPEAHRHGWEILAHLPSDIRATDALAAGTLDTLAQESKSAIQSIVGQGVPIGFVYPQHARSAETDVVLRKYFDRARGMEGIKNYPREIPNYWLTTARFLDSNFSGGGISDSLRRSLRKIAASDSQMVFYMHWSQPNIDGGHPASLTEFVRYARELGIEITTSGQIWGDANLIDDPYFDRPADWSISGAGGSIAAGDAWHGANALKITAGTTTISQYERSPVPSKPGMLTRMEMKFRRKNVTDVVWSAGENGLRAGGVLSYRKRQNTNRVTGATYFGGDYALSGTVTPGEWVEESCEFFLHPAVEEIGGGIQSQLLSSGEVLIDEVQYRVLGYQPEWVTTATLNGTGNVFVYPHLADLSTKFRIKIEPESPMKGTLNVALTGGRILLSSTNAADTMRVRISATPRGAWFDEDE